MTSAAPELDRITATGRPAAWSAPGPLPNLDMPHVNVMPPGKATRRNSDSIAMLDMAPNAADDAFGLALSRIMTARRATWADAWRTCVELTEPARRALSVATTAIKVHMEAADAR